MYTYIYVDKYISCEDISAAPSRRDKSLGEYVLMIAKRYATLQVILRVMELRRFTMVFFIDLFIHLLCIIILMNYLCIIIFMFYFLCNNPVVGLFFRSIVNFSIISSIIKLFVHGNSYLVI